jgi:hypothetical protein
MSINKTTEHRRCDTCGRRHYCPRNRRPQAPVPLLEWMETQRRLLVVQPPSGATLRLHLTMAAEARRRGDYAAAAVHDVDAVLAQRAVQAAARRSMGAPR